MKKIGRKLFFGTLGSGLLGFVLIKQKGKSFTLANKTQNKISISINPLAVKRESKGTNNG